MQSRTHGYTVRQSVISICLQLLFTVISFLVIAGTFAFLPAPCFRYQFSPQGRDGKSRLLFFPTAAVQCISCYSRIPGEVVPVRVRQAVVAIQTRQPSVPDAVVQVAAGGPLANSLHDPIYRGDAPLGGYATHSPRLPLAESRAKEFQGACGRPTLPSRHDSPASPTPMVRVPRAGHSRVPVALEF